MAMHTFCVAMHVCESPAAVDAVLRDVRGKEEHVSVTDWRGPKEHARDPFPCLVQVCYMEHNSTYVSKECTHIYILGWHDIETGMSHGQWPKPYHLRPPKETST
jgi:hypothetical protein